MKKMMAWVTTLCLVVACLPYPSFALSAQEQAAKDVAEYYREEQSGELSDWWELLAVHTLGEDLRAYTLPATDAGGSTPADYAGVIISELVLGNDPAEKAQELAAKQEAGGHFGVAYPNQQAWAMIILDKMGTSYDRAAALDFLLSFQLADGGFGYTKDDPVGDPDLSAMVAIALYPYVQVSDLDAQRAAQDLKAFFEDTQTESGGFASWGEENAATIATVISGLVALGVEPAGFTHGTSGKTPVDALLAYQMSSGAFTYSQGAETADAFSTKQAAIALAELVTGNSAFLGLAQNSQKYWRVAAKVYTKDKGAVLESVTAKENETLGIVAQRAWERAGQTGFTASGYTYILGTQIKEETDTLPINADTLVAAQTGITKIASFDKEAASIQMGESITLKLTQGEFPAGTPSFALAGITILVDGAPYDDYVNATNANGEITLSFLEAGSYTISAGALGEEYSKPVCKITVLGGEQVARQVTLRVEGITGNILYDKNVRLNSHGSRMLTVFDALSEAVSSNGISLNASGGYVQEIDGEVVGTFGQGDGWLYVVNGEEASLGANRQLIENGDEILFYYGDWEKTWLADTKVEEQADGSLEITVSAQVTQYDADWNPSVVTEAIEDATITWGADTFKTNAQGKVTIPENLAGAGYHSMQVEKYEMGGLPLIVRLSPDYTVRLSEKLPINAGNSPLDITGKTPGIPLQIIVDPGLQTPAMIIPADTPLPEIATVGARYSLWIAPNTAVTGTSGYNGIFALPQSVSHSMAGKIVYTAVTMGAADETLTLSQPMRVVLPGVAARTIARIDAGGAAHEITERLLVDSPEAAQSALQGAVDSAIYIDGSDAVIWTTKAGSLFVAYADEAVVGPGPDTVSLRVVGLNNTVLFAKSGIVLRPSDTPISVLLRESGLVVDVVGSYVRAIGSLAEFDYGAGSGWMYQIDGIAPSGVAADAYILSVNQLVAWRYTSDMGEDIGSPYTGNPVPETKKAEEKMASAEIQISGVLSPDGILKGSVSGEEVLSAIEKAKAVGQNASDVLGVDICFSNTNENVNKVQLNIGKESLKALIEGNAAQLRVLSQAISLKLNEEALKELYAQAGAQVAVDLQVLEGGQACSVSFGTTENRPIQTTTKNGLAISFPYSLREGQTPGAIVVKKILPDGTSEIMPYGKHMENAVTFLADGPGKYEVVCMQNTFQDTLNHWAKDDILFLYNRGIVSGRDGERYDPDATVTRAEILRILQGVCGEEEVVLKDSTFTDVSLQAWYARYIQWGVRAGLAQGMGDGRFAPDEPVNRAQAALFLLRMEAYKKWTLQNTSAKKEFVDREEVPSWAAEAVEEMQMSGIVEGRPDGSFHPLGNVTRAEVAVMIRRLIENITRL